VGLSRSSKAASRAFLSLKGPRTAFGTSASSLIMIADSKVDFGRFKERLVGLRNFDPPRGRFKRFFQRVFSLNSQKKKKRSLNNQHSPDGPKKGQFCAKSAGKRGIGSGRALRQMWPAACSLCFQKSFDSFRCRQTYGHGHCWNKDQSIAKTERDG
jgi:hypothetical protein